MAGYIFSLYEGKGEPPCDETVDATDDIDAQSLAEMRLLLTRRFTQIIATRNGHKVCHLRRDSLTARVASAEYGYSDLASSSTEVAMPVLRSDIRKS